MAMPSPQVNEVHPQVKSALVQSARPTSLPPEELFMTLVRAMYSTAVAPEFIHD